MKLNQINVYLNYKNFVDCQAAGAGPKERQRVVHSHSQEDPQIPLPLCETQSLPHSPHSLPHSLPQIPLPLYVRLTLFHQPHLYRLSSSDPRHAPGQVPPALHPRLEDRDVRLGRGGLRGDAHHRGPAQVRQQAGVGSAHRGQGGAAGGHLCKVRRDQPGGGEDLLQPGHQLEGGQPAQERVVRGGAQVQAGSQHLTIEQQLISELAGRVLVCRDGEDCEGRGAQAGRRG